MSGLKVLPVSAYDRRTGKKWGCAFCSSDWKPCGFHEGQLQRALARRQAAWFVAAFSILAAATSAALLLWDAR